jgi:hypothetical protein
VDSRDGLGCCWSTAGGPTWGCGDDSWCAHMPPQAPVVYPLIAVLVNALLAASNGLWLLAPAALLGDLANALDASLAKAFGTLLEAPRVEARGAATAFLRLLVPFVRKGLIEGVYGSSVDVPPSEALQEMT